MAEIFHLRCRHCGEPFSNGNSAYCKPCNTYLLYRAMPILLGMLMIPPLKPQAVPVKSQFLRGRSRPYPHIKDIMD